MLSLDANFSSVEHKDHHNDAWVVPIKHYFCAGMGKVGQTGVAVAVVVVMARTNKRIMLILVMKMY